VCMIWHKSVCPDLDVAVSTPFGHQVDVCLVVVITEKGLHSAVAALSDMVRDAWGNYASDSRHFKIIQMKRSESSSLPGQGAGSKSSYLVWCPRNYASLKRRN
jgi:hypothetical protein